MNPILMEYILNTLAPKQYRLELKNRLENLCSLSGSPMSLGLREWVIQTFGLEMVRVIESYSSLTPPVFSPALQERINRIVPSNYQGYDANLGFKQLFDVTCTPPCFYIASVIDTGCVSFNDPTWDFGGFGPDFTAYANSLGCSVFQDSNESCGFGVRNVLYFSYIGSIAPTDLLIYDPTSGDSQIPFYPCCDFGCIKTTSYQYNYSPYYLISFEFMQTLTYTTFYGADIDFTLGASSVQAVINNILTLYQPQASVSVIDDGGGFFTITFNDVYYTNSALQITVQSGLGIDIINLSPCP